MVAVVVVGFAVASVAPDVFTHVIVVPRASCNVLLATMATATAATARPPPAAEAVAAGPH